MIVRFFYTVDMFNGMSAITTQKQPFDKVARLIVLLVLAEVLSLLWRAAYYY